MAADAKQPPALLDPTSFHSFRFLSRELDARGHVTLRYALDEEIFFVEELDLPVECGVREADSERVDGLLVAAALGGGVSYFKTALPPSVSCETGAPPPAAAALLEALYSEGLGELAYTNAPYGPAASELSRGRAAGVGAWLDAGSRRLRPDARRRARTSAGAAERAARRVLVPVGGGKDSAVALEIVRRSGLELALFSVGDAPPIARTVAVARAAAAAGAAHAGPGAARR